MRADTLRALAAQYRSLALLYPTGGWDIAAEQCEQQARETEARWENETPLGQALDGGGEDGL